jgi:hypothetical protein
MTKHLIRVGEDWENKFYTEGDIKPLKVKEIKDNFIFVDEILFCNSELEKKIIISEDMSIADLNLNLNLWLKIKVMVLYRFLAELLHSKVI